MSKYAIGDKFIVEIDDVMLGSTAENNPTTLYRIKGFNSLVFDRYGLDKLQKYDEVKERLELIDELKQVEYNRGLNDAWELARKICEMGDKDFNNIFGCVHFSDVFCYNTPQEAIAKIEAYEKSKQIQVRDVISHVIADVKAIILDDAIAAGAWQVYTENGCVELWKECEFKKTGKTVDISSILEQIRGNE